MPKININQIKKLRAKTQAPVLECRNALEENDGNLKKAERWLRQRNNLKVAKKKNRITEQGLIHAYIHNEAKTGAMVKLCCESDFVARNKAFNNLAHEIAMQVAAMKPKNVKELLAQEYIRDPEKTIQDLINEAIAKFGENIKIEGFARLKV